MTLANQNKQSDKFLEKLLGDKEMSEANVIADIYKNPDKLREENLTAEDFNSKHWKLYYQIAFNIVCKDGKNILDPYTVGQYVDSRPAVKIKWDSYGGYKIIAKTGDFTHAENFEGYIKELKKYNVILKLHRCGFSVEKRYSELINMSAEEIYCEYETVLNDLFINADTEIRSYNVCDGMIAFVDELDKGKEIGMPFYHAPLLTNEVGGFNYHGNIYGLGAGSGVGKSTMAFNYLIPSCIKYKKQIVFIINEEDEKKFRKELLIWVANNKFNFDIHKYQLRNGHFTDELKSKLKECAAWIEKQKEEKILTVIPLPRYSVRSAVKIINKYSALGVDMFVLDTLKESFDAKTNDIWQSMMRDMVNLYDVVKPKNKNVGLFVTYQLGKGALKVRHLTNNEIGQAKSIVDVMSVNLMMRRPFEDEYTEGKRELKCWSIEGQGTKVEKKLKREDKPMITFITKNRFGETDTKQIVSKCDLSRNLYEDMFYCLVPQDW